MQKKKITITVDIDSYEDQFREEFYTLTKAWGVPRGAFLSRAFYLVCKEYLPERTMDATINNMKFCAEKKGIPFNDNIVADTEEWEAYIKKISDFTI